MTSRKKLKYARFTSQCAVDVYSCTRLSRKYSRTCQCCLHSKICQVRIYREKICVSKRHFQNCWLDRIFALFLHSCRPPITHISRAQEFRKISPRPISRFSKSPGSFCELDKQRAKKGKFLMILFWRKL